ncbi:MAG TPA: rubrerythrin family protein [Clostridiales bacterium]|nr:rubrerythrin family protein [Clostridiales bacterium]
MIYAYRQNGNAGCADSKPIVKNIEVKSFTHNPPKTGQDISKGGNMQLQDTKTLINLARSFSGEAQAGLRYQLTANIAEMQGYKILSDEIRKIAKNEVNHAKVFFNFLTQAGEFKNITYTAGFPYYGEGISGGLQSAVKSENDEADLYEEFASVAEEEGFTEIAEKFRLIAKIELRHADIFNYLSKSFTEDTLYKQPKPVMWVCSECGHIETSTEGWNVCPVCGSTQGFIELKLK